MYYKNVEMDVSNEIGSSEFQDDLSSTVYMSENFGVRLSHIEIRCIRGDLKGKSYYGKIGEIITIGRNKDNSFVFPLEARGVSRTHCSIQYTHGRWTVKDLNSSYGTFVNEEDRLESYEEVRIYSEDVISLGGKDNVIRIHIEE